MNVHLGKDVYIDATKYSMFMSAKALSPDLLSKATDVSGGTKRSAIIMDSGRIYLTDLSIDTLRARLDKAKGGA